VCARVSAEGVSGWLGCFLTVVLLTAACGGGETDGTVDSVPSEASPSDTGTLSTVALTRESLSSTVVSVARAITDRHGPTDGLGALVSAFDVGYDVDQIASAALIGALDLDGTIRIDGSAVAPTGPVAGIIAVRAEDGSDEGAQAPSTPLPTAQSGTVVLVAYAQEPGLYDRADLLFDLLDGARALAPPLFEAPPVESGFDVFESDETAVAALIMALASSGYSIRQITEALTLQAALGLGTIGESDRSLLGACPALFDTSTGELVVPDRPRGTAFCAEPVTNHFAPISPAPDPGQPEPTESVLLGSFGEYPFLVDFEGRPLSSILENELRVDLSGEVPVVGGIFRYLAPTDNYAESAEVFCEFEGILELRPVPLTDAVLDGETWTGTVELVGSQADGTCPAGEIEVGGLEGTGTLSLTISESGMTGVLDLGDGFTWEIFS